MALPTMRSAILATGLLALACGQAAEDLWFR